MKRTNPLTLLAFGLLAVSASAEILQFDLSPPGTSAAVGLSPENEVPPIAVASNGSGGELPGGITFDTDTSVLSYAIGYGSVAGFSNLTGPATAAHIHGPADVDGSAGPINNFFNEGFHLPAPDPADGGVIIGTLELEPAEAADLLAGLLYINIHTEANGPGEIRGQLIEATNVAPTIECPDPVTVECESSEGMVVSLTANVADEDGDPLTVMWMINGEEFETQDVEAGDDATEAEVSIEGLFPLGAHQVVVIVSDGVTDPVTCEFAVTVEDTTPPEIVSVTPSHSVLWPPNHAMWPVTVDVQAVDVCGEVTATIIGVESNEPANGIGDGNTDVDWEITGDLTVDLRAERAGPGNGRVYTITVEAADESGNVSSSTTTVEVPHDMGNGASRGRGRAPFGVPRGLFGRR